MASRRSELAQQRVAVAGQGYVGLHFHLRELFPPHPESDWPLHSIVQASGNRDDGKRMCRTIDLKETK